MGQNIQLLWEQADFHFIAVEQGLVSEENGACWIHKARDSSPLVERWTHERMAAGVPYPAGAAGELISLELTFCADSRSVSVTLPYFWLMLNDLCAE